MQNMRTVNPLVGGALVIRDRSASSRGFTLIDLVLAVALLAIVSTTALPLMQGSVGRWRASSAASYMSSRIARTRFEAVRRSKAVAIQFLAEPSGVTFRTFVDGNHNGVLTADIVGGIDLPISTPERLDHHFAGVLFGIHQGVVGIDPNQPFNAADPIQIGSSTLLSFSTDGSSTGGTLFIRGEQKHQFAVRVLGTTGRTRVLEFEFATQTWRTR
jgi:type II secretory pathway pseudopilin PulG